MNEILGQIQDLRDEIAALKKSIVLADHQHNGFDSELVEYTDINHKEIYISHCIYGADAATAANYGTFYIVPCASYLDLFQEVHQVAGSDGGAVTVMLEKLSGTEAPGSGDDMLSTTLSLKATANTVQSGTVTLTSANRTLKAGDRLCLKDSGTLTSVSNVAILIKLIVL